MGSSGIGIDAGDGRWNPVVQGLFAFGILLAVPVVPALLSGSLLVGLPGSYFGLGGLVGAPVAYLLVGGVVGSLTDGPVWIVVPSLAVVTGGHALWFAGSFGVTHHEVVAGTALGRVVLLGWFVTTLAGLFGILAGAKLRSAGRSVPVEDG